LNKLNGLNSLEAGRLFCRTRIYTDSHGYKKEAGKDRSWAVGKSYGRAKLE